MKVLFTGASSFTGYWFVKELVEAGHEVHTIYTKASVEEYTDLRKERVELASSVSHPHFGVKFGDESFLELVKELKHIDMLCHHAADVTNYKNQDFDIASALNSNTKNIYTLLPLLKEHGCNKILLTGSFFENNEAIGDEIERPFSPYALSKSFTYETFKYYTALFGLQLGKFVISNPFGPYEDFRFTSFLARSWFKGEKVSVKTPVYLRDNIPIDLLAEAYGLFTEKLWQSNEAFLKCNPQGFVESQGAFAERVAREMSERWNLPCELDFAVQTDFPEPKVKLNTDITETKKYSEKRFWDILAEYYKKRYQI